MAKDHDPFKVEADYLEDNSSLSDYVSEYKKEIVYTATTTGLLVTGYIAWNAEEVSDFLNGF